MIMAGMRGSEVRSELPAHESSRKPLRRLASRAACPCCGCGLPRAKGGGCGWRFKRMVPVLDGALVRALRSPVLIGNTHGLCGLRRSKKQNIGPPAKHAGNIQCGTQCRQGWGSLAVQK
jgi:hypothetical protein